MKRIALVLIIVIAVVFIIAQFFQPEKNSAELTVAHILKQEKIPQEVQTILTNACLDCHSNTTNYLWFHHITPVSWMINGHIVDGKDELNLSEWGSMDVFEKVDALDEMCEEIEKGKMPLKSYTAIHAKARLSEEEVKILCEWTEKLSEELMAASLQEGN